MSGYVKVINDQCMDLPNCPVCGYITDLVEVVIKRTKKSGGGRWSGYALRCLNSIDPNGLRRLQQPNKPLCTFNMPLTYQPATTKKAG